MAFLDSLRRLLGTTPRDPRQRVALVEAWGLDDQSPTPEFPRGAPAATPEEMAAPPDTSAYDVSMWRKKLHHLLSEQMPVSEADWAGFTADAQALGLERSWVEQAMREEFTWLVRKAVSDGVVTLEEHHRLDLAKRLIGLSEAEAVQTLHEIVGEAEAIFGKSVEGT
jgi:hypothetical protein